VNNVQEEGIFELFVEFFQFDSKFNENTLSLFEKTLYQQNKSKHSSILISLLLEKNPPVFKKISQNIFKNMFKFV
jgi:hypothetical protein